MKNRHSLAPVRLIAWGVTPWDEKVQAGKKKGIRSLNSVLNQYGLVIRASVSPNYQSIRAGASKQYMLVKTKRPGQPRGIKKRCIRIGSIKELCVKAVERVDNVTFESKGGVDA